MVTVFRTVYFCAIALSFSAAALVTTSLFIQDRAPQSVEFLGISLAVTGFFLTLGVLLYGIQRHVAAIAAVTRGRDDEAAEKLGSNVTWLVAYLLLGGSILSAVLGFLTYVILARIDQGFAVFG